MIPQLISSNDTTVSSHNELHFLCSETKRLQFNSSLFLKHVILFSSFPSLKIPHGQISKIPIKIKKWSIVSAGQKNLSRTMDRGAKKKRQTSQNRKNSQSKRIRGFDIECKQITLAYPTQHSFYHKSTSFSEQLCSSSETAEICWCTCEQDISRERM